jgi:hypothetical protein
LIPSGKGLLQHNLPITTERSAAKSMLIRSIIGDSEQPMRHGKAQRYAFESYSLIVRTTLDVGRVSVIEPFNCFRMASS